MPALPVMVDFGGNNSEGFSLDQRDDDILHLSGWMANGRIHIELWGNTTLLIPTGDRHEVRRFQQVSTIRLTGDDTFEWEATRNVWDDVPWVDDQPSVTAEPTIVPAPEDGVHIMVSYAGRITSGRSQGFFQRKVEFHAGGTSDAVDAFIWYAALGQHRPTLS